MRIIAIIVAILGLGALVYGILFIVQAGTAEKEVATQVAPLTNDQVSPKYDEVTATFNQLMASEEPKIQAKQALPSVTYDYVSAQRALLGLAKSNLGTAKFVRTSGMVDIILGVSMCLSGMWLFRKSMSAA